MSLKRKRDMDGFLTSRHITFIIGPDKACYSVHEKTIAGLSAPLRLLVTGPMRESLEAKVTWEDVEPAVFVNLMEYAYTGDFSISGHVGKTASDDEYFEGKVDTLPKEQKEAGDEYNKKTDVGMASSGIEPKEEEKTLDPSLFETVLEAKQLGSTPAVYKFATEVFNCSQSCKFKMSPDKITPSCNEDIEASKKTIPCDLEYYMSLAKLYVLAEKYGIDELKTLCAFRFSHSIFHAPGSEELVSHLEFVLRYLRNLTRPKDQLRTVVLEYVTTDLRWFMAEKSFRNLLRELPEVATELILMIPSEYWKQVSEMS